METEILHEHFIARLVIERVQHKREKPESFRQRDAISVPTERFVEELTSVVVKQSEIEDLKKKLVAHINLVSDLDS